MQTIENCSALLEYYNGNYQGVFTNECAATGLVALGKCYEAFDGKSVTGKLSFLDLQKDELFIVLQQKSPKYSICEKLVFDSDSGEYSVVKGAVFNDFFDFF